MDENYQGKELQATLRANTLPELQRMLSELQDFARNEEMDEVELLKPPTKDVDGGFVSIITCHNLNVVSWAKERWEGRGGGLGARIQKEQEARELATRRSTMRAEAAQVKARQEQERAVAEQTRATAERTVAKQRAITQRAVRERREASKRRQQLETSMRLESFRSAVERAGGFAGTQAATFQTALYAPTAFVESATKTQRTLTPKRKLGPTRSLVADILDTRMP